MRTSKQIALGSLALASAGLVLPGCFKLERSDALDDRCIEPAPYAAGTQLFEERTDIGLAGVIGQRISAVDVDGDGDADLIVRKVGAPENDTSLAQDDPARSGWLLLNDGTGKFTDGTRASGLWDPRGGFALGRPGEVMAFADVNGDGAIDAFAGVDTTNAITSAGETSEILLSSSNGKFTTGPADSELRRDYALDGRADLPASASFTDIDGDGHLDLWVTEHNYDGLTFIGDRLYRGDGTGRFVDVNEAQNLVSAEWDDLATINAGLAHTRSWSGAACDLDNDGRAELLAASYGRAPNHLWQNRGGSFDNVSVASGYAYDGDFTWQDNQFALCFCEQNPAAAECETATSQSLLDCSQPNWSHDTDREEFRLGGNNATSVCADVDNDGDLDVVTTTIKHWWAGGGADMAEVLINNSADGVVTLDRPGREAMGIEVPHTTGIAWDEGIMTAAVFDVDNDGRQDIYLGGSDYAGNRGLWFHNDGKNDDGVPQFSLMSVEDTFEQNRSHGVTVADFDNDGDLDMVVGHSRSRCDASQPSDCYENTNVRYFENVAGNRNNFVRLRLTQTTGTNSSAIGARVTVKTVVNGETLVQTHDVGGGHGHFGMQDDLVQTFGIGDACAAEVTVRWPVDGVPEQTFTVGAGYRYDVVEGSEPSAVE
ncbi:MAG: VCBS repeat-containing protein [Deltaproteobacteria bacterium]|nr:VCBS repeat-containing protein [Deltaproteobacteria bacterium]